MSARLLVLCSAWVLVTAGCAQKTDWIGGTLVTVDVSGVWRGRIVGGQGWGERLEMTLRQRGPKVTGDGLLRSERISIEGTVRGDVFAFSAPASQLHAELTVTGDEMSGLGTALLQINLVAPRAVTVRLSRQVGGQEPTGTITDPPMKDAP